MMAQNAATTEWDAGLIGLTIGLFILALLLVVVLRARYGAKCEIRTADLLAAVIPVALFLFLTGKIGRFEGPGFAIELAIRTVAETPAAQKLSAPLPISYEELKVEGKGAVSRIDEFVREGLQALSFRLGYTGYEGGAIEKYLYRLTLAGSLKYIVILDKDGKFVGIVDAVRTAGQLRDGTINAADLAEWLRDSAAAKLAQLPGFVSEDAAVDPEMDSLQVLKEMDQRGANHLPVVNAQGRFEGVVDRSDLTSRMVTDIIQKLAAKD